MMPDDTIDLSQLKPIIGLSLDTSAPAPAAAMPAADPEAPVDWSLLKPLTGL